MLTSLVGSLPEWRGSLSRLPRPGGASNAINIPRANPPRSTIITILHPSGLAGRGPRAYRLTRGNTRALRRSRAHELHVYARAFRIKRSIPARIVFTSSTVGHSGRAFWGTYAISKFAVEGMMQILADELSDTAVRVNAINPGATRTRMREKAYPGEDANTLKTPLDIMPLYLHLMDPSVTDVNGQCIDARPKR